jgi:hypothetical protein
MRKTGKYVRGNSLERVGKDHKQPGRFEYVVTFIQIAQYGLSLQTKPRPRAQGYNT